MFILIFGLKLQWAARGPAGWTSPRLPAWTGSSSATWSSTPSCPPSRCFNHDDRHVDADHAHNMVTTLAEDYVGWRGRRACPTRASCWTTRPQNAVLPNLTGFAHVAGFVVGGADTDRVRVQLPGVGYMLLQAVENEDYR